MSNFNPNGTVKMPEKMPELPAKPRPRIWPRILVCTTFANRHWEEHARQMIESFHKHWPQEVGLVITLDDETLYPQLKPLLDARGGAFGTFAADPVYQEFKKRYGPEGSEKRDHPTDYRHMFFRFAHKIFALKDAAQLAAETGTDYLVWLDADTLTTADIPFEKLLEWLPGEGEMASYLGRKDWHHSECGFVGYNLKAKGNAFIQDLFEKHYARGSAWNEEEQHDSWLFDREREVWQGANSAKFKNLSPGVPGMDVWQGSPLQAYMTHFKGPAAKVALADQLGSVVVSAWSKDKVLLPGGRSWKSSEHHYVPDELPPEAANVIPNQVGDRPLNVQVKNCVDPEVIRKNVSTNIALFNQWLTPCAETDEEVVMVSGGPTLDVARVRWYADRGYRIVCVKHALNRLLSAGIVPWGCVLLDPRVHVENFVDRPDTRINWLVASMVDPKVTHKLLEGGCKVWGYHAAVGAGEEQYVAKGTPFIAFGSASSTRGLFVLNLLGFKRFVLLGYDLCHTLKPDLKLTGTDGNTKYLEITLTHQTWGGGTVSRTFWTEGQLLAQAQEVEQIVAGKLLEIWAEGDGMVPWLLGEKKRYKDWWRYVHKPKFGPKPHVDKGIGGAGWRNRWINPLYRQMTTLWCWMRPTK